MARWPITRRGWARILLVLLLGSVLGLTFLGPLWSWPARWAVRKEMDSRGIPGLSLAVAIDGQVRWSAGFGLADVENDVPARPTTVYRLASVSKPITAVAVLQLAERGVIDLNAPIQRYVSSFPEKAWPVTPRLLLSHLGGVRTYKGDELLSMRHYDSLTEALTIFKEDPLVSEPGTKHLYSTYGYNLLGAAVEGASGQSYEAYVRKHIFEPAGMQRTRADDIDALIPGRAQGYFKGPDGTLRNSRPVDLSNKVPAVGLCATAEDLARFAIALQAGILVGPETRRLMWTSQRTRDGQSFGYGLGWNLGRYAGCDYACHVGRQQRVTSLLDLLPERRFAVALLCNLENSDLIPLAQQIADLAAPARSDPASDATTGR